MTATVAPGPPPNPSYKGGLMGKLPDEHKEFKGSFLSNMLAPYLKQLILQLIDNHPGKGENVFGKWNS